MIRAAIPLIALSACVWISDEEYAWRVGTAEGCDAPQTFWADADGDGYGDPRSPVEACEAPEGTVDNDDDCDDTDPSTHEESTFWEDRDGDGWGTEETLTACSAPTGYADRSGDCDDTDPNVHPDAVERCDTSADDDCDGDVNEEGAEGCTEYYADADGDDYGSGASVCICGALPPYTATVGGDCDDADPDVHPGAEEVCFDGKDDDCDGTDGGCGLDGGAPLAAADAVLEGRANSDAFGTAAAIVGDVDGDGVSDIVIGATGGDLGARQAGEAWVFSGPLEGIVPADPAGVALRGLDANDYAGQALAALGDVDSDGFADFAVGVVQGGPFDGGAAWVVHGPVTAAANISSVGVGLWGEASGDWVGDALARADDIDGSGTPGLLVGGMLEDTAGSSAGAVWLVSARVASSADLGHVARATLHGAAAGDRAGVSVAAGDLDGDGVDDLVIGADRADSGAWQGGAVHLVQGPAAGTGSLADADATWWGAVEYEAVGYRVAVLGDVDGDGLDDFAAGGPGLSGYYSGAGRVYAVLSGGPWADASFADADAVIEGEADGDGFGSALAAAGDFDDDGIVDLLVGAPEAGGTGRAYIVRGPLVGTMSAADAWVLGGEASGDTAGAALAGGADLGEDGVPDLVVGAPAAGGSGAAYVFFGGGM